MYVAQCHRSAAGLFYLAELVEEFTGPTKRALRIALLVRCDLALLAQITHEQ